MQAAIYYPDIEIKQEATMRSALFLWDRIYTIRPDEEYVPVYPAGAMKEAWELFGDTMYPDEVQKEEAHTQIAALLEGPTAVEALYRDDLPGDQTVELWPTKLSPKTMALLQEKEFTGERLANGDYPFTDAGSLAVMAKLADACAGDVLARWTDRFLAYGLVADREPANDLQTTILPLALSTVDASRIPLEKLVAYRRREQQSGGELYTRLRYTFREAREKQAKRMAEVRSENQLKELCRQFDQDNLRALDDLADGLKVNVRELVLSKVVVTSAVAAGAWLSHANHLAALVATGAVGEVLGKVAELFQAGNKFSSKQKEIMEKNPMAYLYELSRM